METENKSDLQKLWNINFIILLILSVLTAAAFNMVTPVLTKYATSNGISLPIAGILSGMFSITALFARPFSGAMTDRLNKKKVMVLATSLISLSVMAYSFTTNIAILFLVRIVHGAAFSFSGTCNIVLASTYIPKNRLAEGVGYLGLGHIISMVIGPNLGLWIMENIGIRQVFWMASILAGTAALLMFLLIRYKDTNCRKNTEKLKLKLSDLISVKLIPYAIFVGVFSLCNGLVSTFIALLGDERGIANVGIFFTCNAIMLLAVRLVAGRLTDKYGLAKVLVPSYVFVSVAMFIIAGARSAWFIAGAGVFKAIGEGVGQPAIQAECIRRQPEKRGVAVSTQFIGSDVGQGLGGSMGGIMANQFGYQVMYAGAGVLLLLTMVSYVFYYHFIVKREKERVG